MNANKDKDNSKIFFLTYRVKHAARANWKTLTEVGSVFHAVTSKSLKHINTELRKLEAQTKLPVPSGLCLILAKVGWKFLLFKVCIHYLQTLWAQAQRNQTCFEICSLFFKPKLIDRDQEHGKELWSSKYNEKLGVFLLSGPSCSRKTVHFDSEEGEVHYFFKWAHG